MIPKFSDRKKEAVDFVKLLISESSQEIIYNKAGFMPVNNNLFAKKQYKEKYPELSELREIYKTGKLRPATPEYTKY